MFQKQLVVQASRRGLHEITAAVADAVSQSQVQRGLCHLFVQHTSASLTIQENADPSARRDLEMAFDHLGTLSEERFTHTAEGPDDMPSHVKTALTAVSLTVPVTDGALALGTWQGIYLWEHRDATPARRLTVSVWD
jgi:secondary thiamine-phosphate synthase enzyme